MSSRETTGAARVAAFLLSQDEKAARVILSHLDEKLVAEVAAAMSDLDPALLSSENLGKLYSDLGKDLHRPKKPRKRSEEELTTLLESTIGAEPTKAVMNSIRERRKQERPFLPLDAYPAASVFKALDKESDAVVAVVLAHIDPAFSAQILAYFPPERAIEAVRRMATLVPPPFETLTSVCDVLTSRLEELSSEPGERDPSVQLKTIAEMLNFSEPPLDKDVLEKLTAEDEVMAGEIREFMFTWEDLATIDKRAMQKILASIDTKTLSMAIKASSPEVEGNILGNLSSRVREMVADERDLAGAVPMAEVLYARSEIMNAVRDLMESGEFQPAKAGEDLVT